MSVTELEHADPKRRGEALRAAADRVEAADLPAFVRRLCARLDDEHGFVRYTALDLLGRLAAFRAVELDQEVASKVVNLASDEHEQVRAEVAVVLALLPASVRGPGARAMLRRLLEDPSPAVRQEAAAALGDVGETPALGALAAHLGDPDPGVRVEAAFALASLGDATGLEVLIEALGRPKARLDACEALRRLGPKARGAAPELERLAGRFFLFWAERLTAWATLYAVGESHPAAAKLLERAAARGKAERAFALGLLGTHRVLEGRARLAAIAADPRDDARDTAVRALGELGDASAAEVLEGVALDEGAALELRLEAVVALGKLPPEAGAPRLRALAARGPEGVRSAARRELDRPEQDR